MSHLEFRPTYFSVLGGYCLKHYLQAMCKIRRYIDRYGFFKKKFTKEFELKIKKTNWQKLLCEFTRDYHAIRVR